jgi:hypothetical protein
MANHDILQRINTQLRHDLQACLSSKRQAHRALDTFFDHLVAAGQEAQIQTMAELAAEISAIRLLLAGGSEVQP